MARNVATRVGLVVSLVLGAVAQYEIATCNRSLSEVEWTFNVHRETPCHMWWNLGTACYGGWSLGPLATNNTSYNEPDHNEPCGCSVLAYNLMAACTWCESPDYNSNWLSEKVWATNCDYNSKGVSAFIGNRTFPEWAYVSTHGAKWDPAISRNIAVGKLSPDDAYVHKARFSAGAVAGAVIGAFVGSLLLMGLAHLGCTRYRKRKQRLQQDAFAAKPSINELLYQNAAPNIVSPGSVQTFDGYSDKKHLPGSAGSTARDRDLPPLPASPPQRAVGAAIPDADAIALAILRRVGHEPPQYTPPQSQHDASSSVSSPRATASPPATEFNPYTLYPSPERNEADSSVSGGKSKETLR